MASVDEEVGDYAPPPATLAAQLVNNLTNGRKPSFREEQDDFKLIVAEVSNFDKIKDDNTTLEEITEYNHKLVYVVSKATLEVLINDDPFANQARLIEQASQGLEVLIASIQETPSILEAVAAPDSTLRTGRDIPLWLWLFPRLLTLVGRDRCEALQDRLNLFFKSAFTVSKSPRLSNLASHFFYYLRHCADGQ
jgi:serine/threonine-protein kinase ATR